MKSLIVLVAFAAFLVTGSPVVAFVAVLVVAIAVSTVQVVLE
jgi:hypothetical protein